MTILTAFFSMTGQTYADGGVIDLDKGFTNMAAEYIQEAVGGDLYRIEQARSYSPNHFDMIREAKIEYRNKERPPLKGFLDSIDGYDTVFLCYPNWWGTVPMPLLTFVEHYDWTGKRIVPFVTSAGTGFGRSLRDVQTSAKDATIDPEGLAVLGTKVESSKARIQEWARKRIVGSERREAREGSAGSSAAG